jgi:hypothetical protein
MRKDPRQHRGLVAAAGADLERAARRARPEDPLDHARHDVGLRDRLREADRQRRILVGPAGERFLHEEMPRHLRHRREHALVGDAARAQALDHAVARALRSHADSRNAFQLASHSLARASCAV